MKITWILPTKKTVGGVRVVFEYANRLAALGHEVTCVVPFEQFPYPTSWLRRLELLIREKVYYPLKLRRSRPFSSGSDWFPLQAELIEVPDLRAGYVPDADIVIATAWDTAEWVASYPATKGSKFYFIQHYEVWAGPKERVDATYKLPLKKITIASWLTDKMERGFGEKVYATITNGINLEHFYNEDKNYHRPRRIGMLYHGSDWKGTNDGLKAFALARQRYPDIQLVLFGVKKEPDQVPIPKEAEFHENPSQQELRKLYCSLDIFLSPSWTEGCQLPPMEAMACRTAVVATNVGGIPDYAVAGETALTSPPHDPAALAGNLIRLLEDEQELKRLSEAGYDRIKHFTWEKATAQLEKVLQKEAAYLRVDEVDVLRDFSEFSGLPLETIKQHIAEYHRLTGGEWGRIDSADDHEKIKRFYESSEYYIYDLLYSNYTPRAYLEKLHSFNPLIIDLLKNGSGPRFLEFGGGTGVFCDIMSQLGKDVTYLDIPGKVMDFAVWRFKKYDRPIKLIRSDPTELKLSGQYDVIFSDAVLEHVIDPAKIVGTLCRQLNPNGLFILLVDLRGENKDYPMHRDVDIISVHAAIEQSGLKALAGKNSFCSIWQKGL